LVTYEVTTLLKDPSTAERFSAWMAEDHIPRVMATGCFIAAELSQLGADQFRSRYVASTRAHLDRYLAEHTAALRDHFAQEFGDKATTSRQEWEILREW
jgi:hypothetical protein